MFDDIPPMAVITVVGTLGFIVLSFIVAGSIARRAIKGDPEIRENGIPAQAQILRTWDTGVRFNNDMNVQVGMELRVQPPSGSPYQTKARAVINVVNMPQFQPGVTVPIKIHPTDPQKVMLDIYADRKSEQAPPAAIPGATPVQVKSAEQLGTDDDDKTLAQKLEELEQARSAGLITEDEYERERKSVLDEF